MRRLITFFTLIIIVLSAFASIVGILNYSSLNFKDFVTVSGMHTEILVKGIYKYNIKAWVLGGMPWDIVRLVFGIPLLIVSFILYLKNSLRGTMIFIGVLFSFFYQYILWAIGWHFNALFLVYTLTYGLSLSTMILVIISIEPKRIEQSVNNKFPLKSVAIFIIFIAIMLFFKCVGEIAPTLPNGELAGQFTGYYNLFDQSLDIGIMVPFSIFIAALLIKRNTYGFLLSTVSLILFINLGFSVIAGQAILGIMTDTFSIQIIGITIFATFILIDGFILVRLLKNINSVSTQLNG